MLDLKRPYRTTDGGFGSESDEMGYIVASFPSGIKLSTTCNR